MAPVFEVVGSPNQWERKLHAVAPKQLEKSELSVRRKAFWSDYLERHPEDAELGVSRTEASSVWLPLEPDNALNVSLWVGKNDVGLFVRGPRGASDGGDLVERLEPLAETLGDLLGTSYGRVKGGHFWWKKFRYDPSNAQSRLKAIDWLHTEANRYVQVLSDHVAGIP